MLSLRSIAEARVARLRALGWRGLVDIERDTLGRLVKTTIAATLAYQAGVLIQSPRPVLAALAAIIVVQVTVRSTLARSVQLTVGVTFGLAVATVLGHFFGVHWWTISMIVIAGLIAGELLRLGAMSGQAAISAMLALSLGSSYGLVRVVDTVVGAVIGVLVNALISPPTFVGQASRELRRVAEDLAALLADIGTGLTKRPSRGEVERWLDRARGTAAAVRSAAETVAQGEESLRFNPRRRADLHVLQRIGEARRALDHAITQTRGISRSLLDLREEMREPADWARLVPLGRMLQSSGRAVSAFGRLQERPDSVLDRDESLSAHKEALVQRDAMAAVMSRMDAGSSAQRLVSAVLVDAERLAREVDIAEGAHSRAVHVGTTAEMP